jgi:hypothetical protein
MVVLIRVTVSIEAVYSLYVSGDCRGSWFGRILGYNKEKARLEEEGGTMMRWVAQEGRW